MGLTAIDLLDEKDWQTAREFSLPAPWVMEVEAPSVMA